jgi:hypothetical protein
MLGARLDHISPLVFAGCFLMLISGCGGRLVREGSLPGPAPGDRRASQDIDAQPGRIGGPIYPDDEVVLWDPCSQGDIEELTAAAEQDGLKAIKAASCYAALIVRNPTASKSESLSTVEAGRRYAEIASSAFPESGLAHYLMAHLTAYEAERNPTRGLQLVPVIEKEAIMAASLNPAIDHGGPDRMLGELYLRAPGFPMSVGDSERSVAHFRKAVTHDPSYPENRLGLVEALMAQEENGEACTELSTVIAGLMRPDQPKAFSQTALNLLKKVCACLEP